MLQLEQGRTCLLKPLLLFEVSYKLPASVFVTVCLSVCPAGRLPVCLSVCLLSDLMFHILPAQGLCSFARLMWQAEL